MSEEEVQDTEASVETTEGTPKESSTEGSKSEESTQDDKTLLGGEGAKEVPEKYEFALPEGIEMDEVMIEKAQPLFKELGLSQAQADKLVELYAGQVQTQAADYQKMTEGWKEETIKTLGSDYQQELAKASRFIDRYGDDEVRQVLNDTGLGNHPKIVSMFIKAGKAFSNDTVPPGESKSKPTDPERIARKLFNNTKYD